SSCSGPSTRARRSSGHWPGESNRRTGAPREARVFGHLVPGPRCAHPQRLHKEIGLMNDSMYAGMAEATRLTREGRLAEATALIQRNLGRTQVHPSTPTDRVSATAPIEAPFQVAVEPKTIIEAAALE